VHLGQEFIPQADSVAGCHIVDYRGRRLAEDGLLGRQVGVGFNHHVVVKVVVVSLPWNSVAVRIGRGVSEEMI
jgi:hypothetical protein